ncbi:lactoylglutathione lyase [Xanthomonas sacchari]|uniref:Lactoylglutathione lyase n=1 Tax=Xanthomonas sacchari TaxID=56458 RepID=A0AA46Y7Z1_9XANT|nr:lactoylglutathione lyase [Xanthomonas sacchari]UYK80227.1 lactoylglutathione lyase [Xanthomonas sacchari]UYK88378.1 lactoylglutathione lyase [Xanthomonas sacchari]
MHNPGQCVSRSAAPLPTGGAARLSRRALHRPLRRRPWNCAKPHNAAPPPCETAMPTTEGTGAGRPGAAADVDGRPGVLESTHDHGSERLDGPVYHDGNSEPRGFGQLCVSVPDLHAACARFEALHVPFQKRLSDGRMRNIAFIKDPDGYRVEIISNTSSD